MDFKEYPSYKDSGVEWLDKVPEHWHVANIKRSTYLKGRVGWKGLTSNEFEVESYAYLVTGTDFKNKYVEWSSCYQVNKERFNDDPYIQLKNNDLLITKDGTIGKLAVVKDLDKPACLNSGIFLIRPEKYYLSEYMYYILKSSVFQKFFEIHSTGSTILHLYQNVFEKFSFAYPSFNEQKKIISFLDSETSRIDNLIAKQEKLIEKLEEHRKTVISHAVTKGLDPNVPMKDSGVEWLGEVPEHWKVSSLKRICEVKDGTHDTPSYIEFSESAFPLVTSKNLKKTGLTLNHCKYISKLDYENIIKRSNVKKNDILMPMIGTVGGAVIVNTDEPFAIKNVALFKNNNKICNKWLCYVLNSSLIDIQFLLFKNGGVQDFIGLNDLRNLIVPNIPLSQQKLITNYLDKQVYKIDHSIDKQRELIEKLKNYRTSIISHAVTGKIDVRDLVA